jgi:hypothetical protein
MQHEISLTACICNRDVHLRLGFLSRSHWTLPNIVLEQLEVLERISEELGLIPGLETRYSDRGLAQTFSNALQ